MPTKWLVETSKEKVTLTAKDLVETLMTKIANTNKPELQDIVDAAMPMLESSGFFRRVSIPAVLYTGALLGYYYSIFLKNNSVKIENPDATKSPSHGDATGN